MRLAAKFVAVLAGAVFASTGATGAFAFIAATDRLTEEGLERLEAVATLHEQRLADIYDEHLERYHLVASRTQLRNSMQAYLETHGARHQERMVEILLDAKESSATLWEITLISPGGRVAATTDASALGEDWSQRQEIRQAATVGLHGWHLDGGMPVLNYSGPLQLDGQPIGSAVVSMRIPGVLGLVSEHSGLGTTGEVVLAIPHEGGALFLAPVRSIPDAALRVFVDDRDFPIVQAVQGDAFTVEGGLDHRGERVIAVGRNVDASGWGLVVKMDMDEVEAPARELILPFAGIMLVTAGATGIVALAMARSLTRPLGQLQRAARRLGEQSGRHRVDVPRDDELASLARSFNQMAERVHVATQELGQQTERLRRKNEHLESFASMAAHDLKSPLRTICAHAELLIARNRFSGEEKEWLQHIAHASKRMHGLVEELLQFSRLGELQPALETVDMKEVLAQVERDLAATLEAEGATLHVECDLNVAADRAMVQQVLQNLVENALKYRSDNEAPRIRVRCARDGAIARFSVQDNGIGIPSDQVRRVFRPFGRLHSDKEIPGTGMGLALCQRIVEAHGGRIWCESPPGGGTVFSFTLPAAGHNGPV